MKRAITLFFMLGCFIFFVCYTEAIGEQVFNTSLDYLPFIKSYQAKRISSHDRYGDNHDFIALEAGETAALADIQGPGCITHIWCTLPGGAYYGRKLVLRMYWDGEENPSVEAPLGDFFGVGHGLERNYTSLPFTITSYGRARNCFFKMPFLKSAKIELTNEGYNTVTNFYYYIDYRTDDALPEDIGYFHAQYNQAYPCNIEGNYVILEAGGSGNYVGCNMSIESTAPFWWGEGDDMIYIDRESSPSLHGTGTEDYFCDAWGMRESSSAYYGSPLCEGYHKSGLKTTMYRFHIEDPIPFEKGIRVTIEHGTENNRADNLSSVAYWYQTEPHQPFNKLAALPDRLPEVAKVLYDFESLAHRAAIAESRKEYRQIIGDCYDFIKEHPDFAYLGWAKCLRGLMYERLGELEMAKGEYKKVIPFSLPLRKKTALAEQAERQIKMIERQQKIEKEFRVDDALIIEARNALGLILGRPCYQESKGWRISAEKDKSKLEELLGHGSRYTFVPGDVGEATFTPEFPRSGVYEVFVTWCNAANAKNVQYIVKSVEGENKLLLDQHGRGPKRDANSDTWHSLGEYKFKEGLDKEKGSVTINAKTCSHQRPTPKEEFRVYADAIKFVLKKESSL